ncbi:hypothetical protein STW0522CIT26_11840 [Citrobacter portucalensis]|nr:hypothetical protein STW0522CIT26_11840 [Citrobacter portucalensis]BBW10666.1 hypothetical protein STN0717CIT27_11420 [Citrobacter portucalensis]
MTTNHPAHGPVSLDRLHQICEILSKAAAQSDGGNLGYAMADAVKVIDEALKRRNADSEPVEPIWRATKYPVSRPVPGAKLIVWDETGKFVGYGSSVDTRDSGVAIQMSDGRRLDSNHDLRWQYALQPAPVVPEEITSASAPEVFEIAAEAERLGLRGTYASYAVGWNACRTAMLQGKAEHVSEPCELREQVRREHAAWSQATFGDVGPVGPLKHLSKEALEAAAEPDDLSEWADMQFLLWDAQRRAGISDEQITLAMVEKLAVNKTRQWPEAKDGEPRLHIKEQPAPVTPDGSEDTKRLDWLDAQNKRLNEYYGTSYGWKFDANFQRNAMMLNDSNYPVMTVRQAIDEAIAEAKKRENI